MTELVQGIYFIDGKQVIEVSDEINKLTIEGGFNFKTTISGSMMGTNFGTNKSTDSSFNIVQTGDEIITINKTMTIEQEQN
jgi:hypothetical protein